MAEPHAEELGEGNVGVNIEGGGEVWAQKCIKTRQARRICLMELEIRLASTQG